MGKFIDETGKKYGLWTVIERDMAYPSTGRWVCQCECGTIKTLYGSELRRGRSISCGCHKKKDLTGQKFGKLKIIRRADNVQKWVCECECGRIKEVYGTHLTGGKTKSCGMYPCKEVKFEDLTGQKFGMLTVIERDNSKGNGKGVYFLCRCECGNYKSVLAQHLKGENIISCGCYNRSKGEDKINDILVKNNCDFEPEYVCHDLTFDSKKPARFDFKVIVDDKFYFIEFDGKQHFDSYYCWGGEEELAVRQKHDEIKNNYCKTNNIPLIRIPYTKYKSLKINDLDIYESKYVKVRGWLGELPENRENICS